jgi:glucosamine--fructose-6-phosphate aminotransferase (isomerizing)
MRREIEEQAHAIRETLEEVSSMKTQLRQLAETKFEKVIFIARGTSDNVAAYGIFLFPIVANIEAYSLSPSLLNSYDVNLDLTKTLVVAISQSGETQEIVTASMKAKSLGATVVCITNNSRSSLEKISDICLVTAAGNEKAVPATKTYTTALAGLAAIISAMYDAHQLEKLLAQVPEIMERQLKQLVIDTSIIELLAASQTAVFAGRGIALGAVFEAALKLKETCAINVIGTSVADFVHGPIAALGHGVPLVVFSADSTSPIYPGLVDLMQRARATESPVVTVGGFQPQHKSRMDIAIGDYSQMELIAPLLLAVPSQLLAASVSDSKGLNADSPAVLNKVTQTT